MRLDKERLRAKQRQSEPTSDNTSLPSSKEEPFNSYNQQIPSEPSQEGSLNSFNNYSSDGEILDNKTFTSSHSQESNQTYHEEYSDSFKKPQDKSRGKKLKIPNKPLRKQTEELDISMDIPTAGGEIEGSDFDSGGRLKKKHKKDKKQLFGKVAVFFLILIIGVGAFVFTNRPEESPPSDLTNEEPINDPIKDKGQYTSPISEEPTVYTDDIPIEDLEGLTEDSDESELTPEEQKQRELEKLYADYLTHDNTYTNFSIKYHNTWYITEKAQESFNEIKVLAKDKEFSFKTLTIQREMNLLEFKSPSKDNQAEVTVVAIPTKNFNKSKLYVNFELPSQVKDVQPPIFTKETWGTRPIELGYFLKQEFGVTYLVVQAHEKVGNNILMYTFKEPFFNTAEYVAEEGKEDAYGKIIKGDGKLTVEELKILAPSLEIFKNMVSSIEYR